ncbi:6-phosphogluconolactonase [Micractinium conductrix]|uniref:6-phosphogluconolactonase n=1 Tax=Micractinium conductrix TaxID=554055 RepID=A0A2P6VE13_9CHLO|nr:6-phosphogluconolactonase [Micractinium conductrix]|eukprot:PSC72340.1 6-phosphogluconolactonase [Micractinium conductrix]
MQLSVATSCRPVCPVAVARQQARRPPPPAFSAAAAGGRAAAARPHRPGRPVAASAAAPGTYQASESAAGSVVVQVLPDEAAVAAFLCDTVERAAAAAVEARGSFTLAIPGGSVLKALKGLAGRPIPWDKTRIFFVNHKCVPKDDPATSSYAKARALFLDAVGAPGCAVPPSGTESAEAEAAAYAAALSSAADAAGMERAPGGAPRFDLMLIGVGSDGHVGSLYPNNSAVFDPSGALVLPVVKAKPPASITLSLAVMNAAREVLVCLTGASKSGAARLALETTNLPAGEFPAQLVRPDLGPATWVLDTASAAELSLAAGGERPQQQPAEGQQGGGRQAGMPLPDGSILYTF